MMQQGTQQTEEPPRLGAILQRLEQIRRDLDREDLELEAQLELYREGCGHVIMAKQILGEVRAEIETLTGEAHAVPTRGAETTSTERA